jgi:hypothetical protein
MSRQCHVKCDKVCKCQMLKELQMSNAINMSHVCCKCQSQVQSYDIVVGRDLWCTYCVFNLVVGRKIL